MYYRIIRERIMSSDGNIMQYTSKYLDYGLQFAIHSCSLFYRLLPKCSKILIDLHAEINCLALLSTIM